ncbi:MULTISPECIES: DsbA family protein [unclassified Aeromicrobium]|uniref:DsbA family oxidoreductase n=1 Tax=unclassified Aeromicrobium TaxID=2633570 RepID=UPI0006F2638E|nr:MULTISPECIES: DsbA family oxidoreductase [unclassified Aeromicrobium]KQP24431.1 disulfide bond formation protein DsbA [Aeromicrobium sp. Leaf272]KQP76179.1 disulfide bond formation protein DsbA [Aeromicrobium sp. Leaf289]
MTVDVQIWSDVACPWCYVGKRRFEQAVERFRAEGGDVSVTYRSFELSPETPVDFEGDEVDFLARHKGMQRDQVVAMLDQMTVVAADEGLAYDFAGLQHTNTVLAHQLLHLARSHGQQAAMKERLLAAYFVEGRHVGRVGDLADLAAEVGLDREEVVAALESGAHLDDVRADQQRALELGIRGVPFFVLDDRLGVSGAQDPEVLLGALRQAAEGSA